MNRYTIYCTEEQTRKALELGAPIFHMGKNFVMNGEGWFQYKGLSYCCPTAEQMIGWLEEQHVFVCVIKSIITINHYHWEVYVDIDAGFEDDVDIAASSSKPRPRKEATIAAIDVALEYFTNNKHLFKK